MVASPQPVTRLSYSPRDRERFVPEEHSSIRGDFQRDRGRIIHSSGFRRLAQKTQVLSPTSGMDFARNRLTHSLEVAQVGREIGEGLGLDPDVVDTACLAHDLGHPPFGHNGESAIAAWAAEDGGFEGNAQTFRVLTRLEPKIHAAQLSRGVNLTRASLDAASKYPWPLHAGVTTGEGREKFGVYESDWEVFSWLRRDIPDSLVSLEAQVMDLADDIAYSVHDFEDAIVGGYLRPSALDQAGRDTIDDAGSGGWDGEQSDPASLERALSQLAALTWWPEQFEATRLDFAGLKNLTSALIGRFAQSVSLGQRQLPGDQLLDLPERYRYVLVVPEQTRSEIALLKAMVAKAVMGHETRQPIYRHQREILTSLLETMSDDPLRYLEPMFAEDFAGADSDTERRRVLIDQVASLTDQAAISWHERMQTGAWG